MFAEDPPLAHLVGDDRLRLVDDLVAAFDAGGVQMVSLEAPRGWGKTRLVHELFRRLATRPGQEYWPTRLSDGSLEGSRTRHIVYPADALFDGSATIPWLWWGLTCQLRPDGRPVQVLADALTQVETHGRSLLIAAGARGTMRSSATSLSLAVLGTLVPGVGLAASGAKAAGDVWKGIRASSAARRTRKPGELPDPDDPSRADVVERVLSALRAAGAAELPVIMVVDDIHHADPSLLELIGRLLSDPHSVGSVLIVTTGWPDQLTAIEPLFADATVSRRVVLDRLTPSAMRELVLATAPATDGAVVDALTRRADGNPLVLNGLIDSRRVRRAKREDRIELSPEEVERLPNSYRAQLEERWRELDEPVREALAIAALQGRDFLDELVTVAGETLEWEDDPGARLRDVSASLSWVRRLDQFYVFQELYLVDLALREIDEILDGDEVRSVTLGMGRHVQATLNHQESGWAELPPRLSEKLMELDIALAVRVEELRGDAAESALQLGALLANAGAAVDAEYRLRQGIEFSNNARQRTRAVPLQASLLALLGRIDDALDALTAQRSHVEDGSTEAAFYDKLIADALLGLGRVDEAETVARRALEAGLPWAEQGLTSVLLEQGAVRQALEHQQSIVDRLSRNRNLNPSTIGEARLLLATIHDRLGQHAETLSHATGASAALEEEDGPSGDSTLRARALEAIARDALGEREHARVLLNTLVEIQVELESQPPLSRMTVTNELARALLSTGRVTDAAQLLTQLRPEWEPFVDPAHQDAGLANRLLQRCDLLTRHRPESRQIVVGLIKRGLAALAIDYIQHLVASSASEPLDLHLKERGLLIAALWHAGEPERALAAAVTTADLAVGHQSERRCRRELERLTEWMERPDTEATEWDDLDAAVRDALLTLAADTESSPILEMSLLEISAVGPWPKEPTEIAALAVVAVLEAAQRLREGYPSFAVLQPSADYRLALAVGCRWLVDDGGLVALLTRLDPAITGEVKPDDSPEEVARVTALWTMLALLGPDDPSRVNRLGGDLAWLTKPVSPAP